LLELAGNPPTVEDAVRLIGSWVLSDIPCPPTDLEAIRPRLDITGFFAEDLPFAGELRRDRKGFKIVYAANLPLERRRFTLAHEMGHAIFEASGPKCPRTGPELERLCDLLATEILMPTGIFLDLSGVRPSLQKVFELAKLFKTSLSATAIRCAELRGASVFEVEDGIIRWSRGIVRKMQPVLKPAIDGVLAGKCTAEIVYLQTRVWTGEWQLEGAPIGRGNRALFLLQPMKPAPHPSA
jgi:hypothetical protein